MNVSLLVLILFAIVIVVGTAGLWLDGRSKKRQTIGEEAGRTRNQYSNHKTIPMSEDIKRAYPGNKARIGISEHNGSLGRSSAEANTELICPVCQTVVAPSDRTIICSRCLVRHYKECWEMLGGCSTFGCSEGPSTHRG